MYDWTYNNFLGSSSKKENIMKYNEPFTMNDKQLARFKAGKKVFSEGKCDVLKEYSVAPLHFASETERSMSDIEQYNYIRKMWDLT